MGPGHPRYTVARKERTWVARKQAPRHDGRQTTRLKQKCFQETSAGRTDTCTVTVLVLVGVLVFGVCDEEEGEGVSGVLFFCVCVCFLGGVRRDFLFVIGMFQCVYFIG